MDASATANVAFSAKVRAGVFATVRRSLSDRYDGDDRFQEGLAQTWYAFQRHHETTGAFLSDGALVVLCRRRAWSRRDYFVPRPRGKFRLDVLEVLSRKHADVCLVRDHDVVASDVQYHADNVLDVVRAVDRLDDRNREVALGMVRGETTREIGRRLALSSSSVTRMEQRLQRQLREVAHG